MASRTLDVRLNATDNLSPAFQKAGNAAKTLGDSLDSLGKGSSGIQSFTDQVRALDSEIKTVGQAMTGFGAGITAAVGLSVRSFAGLEAAMANVGTIAGQSDAWLASMTEQIKSLAVEMGTSPTGLAEGLYDLIGSGIEATEALGVLRASAIAAKAGLTDTGTAARAITAVLNAYGKSASEAGNVSDVLFRTVDSGVISFEELANSMGRALPLANQLNVSIEDLGAAYAELTRQGVSASEAETAFTALLTAAINPTEALTEAVREYGYESAEAMIQTEGFAFFLQFLWDVSGGSAGAMSELTGNVRATNGALILAQDGAQGFLDRLTEMNDAAMNGEFTLGVFNQQMDTVSGAASRLQASLSVLGVAVGEAFAPFARAGLEAATSAINGIAGAIQSLPGPLEAAAAGLVGLAGGASLLAGGLLLMLPRIVETRAALQALGGVRGTIGLLAGAFNPLTLAITGAVGAGVLIYENMRRGSEAARNYATSVEALAEAVEQLRIVGDDTRADFLEGAQERVDGLVATLDDAEMGALTFWEALDLEGKVDPTQFSTMLAADFAEAISMADEVNERIATALSNPNIDAAAYNEFITDLFNTFEITAEGTNLPEIFRAILTAPLSDFRVELDETMSGLGQMGELWKSGISTVVADLQAGEDALAAIEDRATSLSTTLDDIRIGGDFELANQLGQLNELMLENADSSEAYLDAQDRINGALQDGSINYAAVAAEITSLNAQLDAGTITQEEYEARIISLSQNLANYTDGSRNAGEATAALTAEFANAALALGGWDNALSRLNMTGMTGEVGMFAEGWSRANLAMENSFRIIVGNTNAIIQQVDGIQSWADSLINVRDELGEIDNLLRDGFIDETIYNNAQNAYDQIAVSTGNIRGNLLAVQAIQAPWIAEVVAGTERWAAELRNMPEDVQRTTLAFMDMQTVTQAQELITLGNSAAFREMGDAGKAAFEATIQGALQTNPLLYDVLKTMGIINETPLGFEVDYGALEEAGSAMDQLIASVDNLVDTLREIHGLEPLKPEVDMSSVEAAASPGGPLGLLKAGFDNLRDAHASPTVDVQVGDGTGGAPYILDDIASQLAGIDGMSATATVNVIAGSAAVGDGTGGASNWRDMLDIPETIDTTVNVTGAEQVAQVKADIDSLDDKTVTVDVVIGTNELDTGLAQFGIGTGGGGGPAGYTAPSVTVNVEADASDAIAQLEAVAGAAAAADALSVNIPAGAPGAEDASQKLEYLAGRAAAADALSVTVPVDTPGSQTGIDQLQGVAGAAAAADAMSVTIPVSVSGAYTAIAQLNDVANAAENASRTVTITTYHRTVGVGVTAQHGGIPSYATGGVVFRGAEGNRPEIAHFANGGTALLPRDGLYMAPPMTYISPHNSSTSYGGDTIYETTELHIHGNVYGIDDLAEAFEGAISRRRRAYGLEANA